MDITGIDIAGLLAGLGAFFKSLHSDTKTKAISDDRERTKQGIDSRFVKLETVIIQHDKRLDEGDHRFIRFENELREANGLLREVLGILKGKGVDV